MDVLIVGGGFAGVQAARSVTRSLPGASVTVIDRTGYATMIPALPDALSGRIATTRLARPLDEALPAGVQLRVDTAVRVDGEARRLHTADGVLPFDALILAPGSVSTPVPAALSGAPWHSVATLEAAMTFRRLVAGRLSREGTPEVLIVGGGYTGLETALALRGSTRTVTPPGVTVVEAGEDVLPMVAEGTRGRLKEYLRERGVDLRLATTVQTVEGTRVRLSDGTVVDAPILCWAAGMRAAPIDLGEDVLRAPDGRVDVDEFLRVPGLPGVFAAGDMALLRRKGTLVRRAVNFAYYSGRRAGSNAAAYLTGGRLRRFTPVDLGWVIPLGDASAGRVFGAISVGGRLGLRMHYTMSGFRHFGGGYGGEYYRTALNLRRRPAPLDAPAAGESP
jgi:NADH:ubiquinone reductase (H+-translocating)